MIAFTSEVFSERERILFGSLLRHLSLKLLCCRESLSVSVYSPYICIISLSLLPFNIYFFFFFLLHNRLLISLSLLFLLLFYSAK